MAGLRAERPDIWLSVSVTTRSPRPGEVNGREYHFVSDEAFEAMVARGELLEWAGFAGKKYGTPRAPVEERVAAGVPTLLEIDIEGARQVRRRVPGALLVFLAPPSREELARRLTGRGTESAREHRPPAGRGQAGDRSRPRVRYHAGQHVRRRRAPATGNLDDGLMRPLRDIACPIYGRHTVAGTTAADGITNPPIDDLLDVVDSKYRLVIMAAKRARQINAYYAQLGEGLLEYVGPLVETRVQEKPLSIALREIREGLLSAVETAEP